MSSKIIFLKGLPASGKTTWAKQYCKDNPEFKRINKDDIREEFGNPKWSREFEKKVLETQRFRGVKCIEKGFSLIIDDTNFSKKHKNYWEQKAREYGLEFTEKFFDTPVEQCIHRDESRQKSVGKSVILNMYNKYLK